MKLDVLKFYFVLLILRLGLFLVFLNFFAILSLDVLIKKGCILILKQSQQRFQTASLDISAIDLIFGNTVPY